MTGHVSMTPPCSPVFPAAVIARCSDEHFTVDGTVLEACASVVSR